MKMHKDSTAARRSALQGKADEVAAHKAERRARVQAALNENVVTPIPTFGEGDDPASRPPGAKVQRHGRAGVSQ